MGVALPQSPGALAGESEAFAGGDNEDDLVYRVDGTMLTLEAAFGIEYLRHFKHHDLIASFLAESNYWDTTVLGPVAFNGASIQVGFQW